MEREGGKSVLSYQKEEKDNDAEAGEKRIHGWKYCKVDKRTQGREDKWLKEWKKEKEAIGSTKDWGPEWTKDDRSSLGITLEEQKEIKSFRLVLWSIVFD